MPRTLPPRPALALAALLAGAPALAAQQPPIRGFPADALQAQAEREALARSVPSADTIREQIRLLSEVPHEAGTERSRRVAEAILVRFRAFGLPAEIERFEALMPRPVSRTLEMVAPERYTAKLKEPALPQDKDSGDPDQLPTYNAYAADGDVTAELVYVNYGIPRDYEVLDSLGIDVKGKIVIARYGASWRGIKPKVAAEHGAVGCIIYSDPRDDGYWVDDVYPAGPMRPATGVQRGSVMDMPRYPGDPLSPGWASEVGSRRLSREEAATLMRIPVLPIGYEDALPLLRHLGGPVAPESWRGALPITYHVGPGGTRVHLAVKFDWQTGPLYDVIAKVPGARSPEQWVVYGNHHDAWVNGAEDPISGQVALNEAARAVGRLLKSGWRPARTLVFAAWDGEEWGLLGSTEWAEKHADELRSSAVVYFNSDTNARGWLGASGSHSLEEFVRQVARDVRDPKTGKSALDAAIDRRIEQRARGRRGEAASHDTAGAVDRDTVFTVGALGSGSDYTAFIDHLGVPSMNLSYGGAQHAGIYHSIYDSYDFYRRFLDPTFEYGVLEAQTLVTAMLRLADAPVLPFEFTRPARIYRRYAEEIAKEAKDSTATAGLDLGAVTAALDRLDRAAARWEQAYARVPSASSADLQRRWSALEEVNRTLYRSEQRLASPEGLPRREWFRHLIYAPGYYTGYGVKTMPGIREAVEDVPDGAVAQREAARVAAALQAYAAQVERAADQLDGALR
jgi:N-acetylated-alpha-linked acidic dipeptidase